MEVNNFYIDSEYKNSPSLKHNTKFLNIPKVNIVNIQESIKEGKTENKKIKISVKRLLQEFIQRSINKLRNEEVKREIRSDNPMDILINELKKDSNPLRWDNTVTKKKDKYMRDLRVSLYIKK